MNGEKISRCLDALPDEMLSEAMGPYRPRSLGWHIVRIAACLAIVIGLTIALWPKEETPGAQLGTPTEWTTEITAPSATMQKTFFAAPGILKVYACNANGDSAEQSPMFELTDGINSWLPAWSPYVNVICHGITLRFQFPDDYYGEAKISFDLSADYGRFFNYKDFDNAQSEMTISNNATVLWDGEPFDEIASCLQPNDVFYIYVIIRADSDVVGYGIIEVEYRKDSGLPAICYGKKFTTVCFPMVDGEFQNITEEYAWEQIERSK